MVDDVQFCWPFIRAVTSVEEFSCCDLTAYANFHGNYISLNLITAPSSFLQCSKACGGGERSRTISCLNLRNGEVVSESMCSGEDRPAETEACNLEPCPCEYSENFFFPVPSLLYILFVHVMITSHNFLAQFIIFVNHLLAHFMISMDNWLLIS